MAPNPYFVIIFEFAFLFWWIFSLVWVEMSRIPKGDYCTVHPSSEALSRPVPIPSCSGDQSPIIHSKPPRTHLPPIHLFSHSFIPSPRDPCKHQPFIANMTYSSIFDTFRSACGEMSCSSLLNWLICNWTCFPWTMLGCLYFCHIHLRTVAMHCCLSTLRQISVYLPHKDTPTWKAT